jgi:hypothetical protein
MTPADHFHLFGTYRTPRVRIGTVLWCEYRDCDVVVTRYTDAPLPWPVGQRKGTSDRGPVVFGGLADAVRRESNQAVAHWWGEGPGVVSRWRKAQGIGRKTVGSHQLRLRYSDDEWVARCQAACLTPEVKARIEVAHESACESMGTRRQGVHAKGRSDHPEKPADAGDTLAEVLRAAGHEARVA